jgi:hypothetical protein
VGREVVVYDRWQVGRLVLVLLGLLGLGADVYGVPVVLGWDRWEARMLFCAGFAGFGIVTVAVLYCHWEVVVLRGEVRRLYRERYQRGMVRETDLH